MQSLGEQLEAAGVAAGEDADEEAGRQVAGVLDRHRADRAGGADGDRAEAGHRARRFDDRAAAAAFEHRRRGGRVGGGVQGGFVVDPVLRFEADRDRAGLGRFQLASLAAVEIVGEPLGVGAFDRGAVGVDRGFAFVYQQERAVPVFVQRDQAEVFARRHEGDLGFDRLTRKLQDLEAAVAERDFDDVLGRTRRRRRKGDADRAFFPREEDSFAGAAFELERRRGYFDVFDRDVYAAGVGQLEIGAERFLAYRRLRQGQR